MLTQIEFKEKNLDKLKRKHRLYSKTDFDNFCINEYLEYVTFLQKNDALTFLRGIETAGSFEKAIKELESVDAPYAKDILKELHKLAKNEQETLGY